MLILYGFVSCAFNTYLFFCKEGNALYDVHMYIELSTIFGNIQIFLVFIYMFSISGKYFCLIFMKKWTVRMSKQPFPLKNRFVVEVFKKFNGNQKKLHSVLCSIADFLKFVFIFLDIGPAPRNFLLDPLNFCQTYIFIPPTTKL